MPRLPPGSELIALREVVGMAPLDAATVRCTVRTLAAIPETCLPGEGSTPFVVPSGWSPLAVDSAGRRDRAPARMPALARQWEERSGERRPEGAALKQVWKV